MNTGEMIQLIRQHERTLLVQEERIKMLEKTLAEMKEILKSPIRREVYATRQK